jgi:rubrerythrin
MTALAADPQSILNALTVMSAEQQTMNFYNTIGNRFVEPLARGLYLEIAQIEEQHVSHYESILDPSCTMLENLAFHEYNECWIYYSFMQEETDPKVKALYELHLAMEIEHLRIACELVKKIERRDPAEFLPAAIERPLQFKENKAYVRQVLAEQIELTSKESEFVPISSLPENDRYFAYNGTVNSGGVPTEDVITRTIEARGKDYRLETEGPNPVAGLQRQEERKNASTDYAKRVAAE